MPKSGNAIIGFGSMDDFSKKTSHREYFELSISQPLVCGNTYYFEMYINLANLFRYSFNGFEFYFSEKELNDENNYLYNLYTPQVIDTTTLVADTLNWVKISFDFVADKPYKFVSIGNKKSNNISDYLDVFPSAIYQDYASYFYVDSVTFKEVKKKQIEIPNVFTPNNDDVNDVFQPKGEVGYFENLLIFNRWGNEVANLTYPFLWNGTTQDGNEASEGVYFYLLNSNESCKQEQKQGMIHLVR